MTRFYNILITTFRVLSKIECLLKKKKLWQCSRSYIAKITEEQRGLEELYIHIAGGRPLWKDTLKMHSSMVHVAQTSQCHIGDLPKPMKFELRIPVCSLAMYTKGIIRNHCKPSTFFEFS
jgi:hypothetical protein